MKNKTKTILAMATMAACFAATAQASNIVVNGSFEGSTYSGPNGDVVPTGWTVGPPSYVIQSVMNVESTVNPGIYQGPEDGLNYIAFQSPSIYGRDCLYQNLATTAGQEYDISFWVAITASSVSNNIGLDVEWDEGTSNQTALDQSAYSYPSNTGPVDYVEYTFTELASTNDTRIDFHAVDSSGAILLDNVVVQDHQDVTATPEPFSFVLAGSGLLFVGLAKRKRGQNRD